MILITKDQLFILSQSKYKAFIEKMIEFVLDHFDVRPDNQVLRKEIVSIIQESEGYGFREEATIEQYIFLKYEYPEFSRYPLSENILEILNFPDREPYTKIDELIYYFESNKSSVS
jgi:hypothetical protein